MVRKVLIKVNRKDLIFLGIFYFCVFINFGQNSITTTQFLNTVNANIESKSDSVISLLNEYNYNIPLIKGVQFRTETKDLQLNRQEYTLRVKPNSLSSIKNQKRIYLNKIEKVRLENQLSFNKGLEIRYLLIVDFIFNERLIKLNEIRKIQLKDKLKILGAKIYDTNFDVKDLIDTEENLQDLELKLLNLKEIKSHLQNVISRYLNSREFVTFNVDDLIKPHQIVNLSTENLFLDKRSDILLQEIELNLLESQMQYEKSKSNQILDYIQTKYGGRRSFLFDENFSIGIGINLPFFGNTKQKKGAYYFDKLNAEHKYEVLKNRIELKEVISNNEFKKAKLNYQTHIKLTKESSISALLDTYKSMEGVSPLILLKLEILKLKKETETLKSQHELYKSYIKFLAVSETLFQKPYRNYLTAPF
jgi:uncharacterized protein YhbP (UPF0306 family)